MTHEEEPVWDDTDSKFGDTLRTLVRQENDLTNHRTTWLLVTQGILAAAASSLLRERPWYAVGLGVAAVLLTLSIGHALKSSYESRRYFKSLWRKRVDDKNAKMDVVLPIDGGFPDNGAIAWLLPWSNRRVKDRSPA
ncbi:MAG: hypothetical protein H6835_15095 [Planctomycetes bacterium]|nr:hypothetical protein [Planctomycetota bacterium]